MKLCTDCKHVERYESGKVVTAPWCHVSLRDVDVVTGAQMFWSADGSRQHGPCGMDAKLFEPMNGHSVTDNQATRQQLDALDASYYRWIRDHDDDEVVERTVGITRKMAGYKWNEAIAAAILAESKEAK